MQLSAYNARLALNVAGPQATSLDTHRRPKGKRNHLVVAFDTVLVYCHSPRAVLTQGEAWTEAFVKSGQVFPDGYAAPRPRVAEQAPTRGLVLKLNSMDADTWDVTGYTAAGSPDGLPLVSVRVGALTLHCRDFEAIADLHRAWYDALIVAPALWQPAPERQPTIAD